MQLLTERVARYSIGVTMPEGYADGAMLAGLADGLDRIPPHLLRSITFDQGSEWGCSETVASTYGMDVWFSDPHSPWQRGQVENLNRQWRFWFPWGTDLASVARAHVDHVASMSTDSAAAASATRAPPRCTLPPPCSDHWNWPTHSPAFSWFFQTRYPWNRTLRYGGIVLEGLARCLRGHKL